MVRAGLHVLLALFLALGCDSRESPLQPAVVPAAAAAGKENGIVAHHFEHSESESESGGSSSYSSSSSSSSSDSSDESGHHHGHHGHHKFECECRFRHHRHHRHHHHHHHHSPCHKNTTTERPKTHPTYPTHPTHPSKPTHHHTHPTHPTHPPKPTHHHHHSTKVASTAPTETTAKPAPPSTAAPSTEGADATTKGGEPTTGAPASTRVPTTTEDIGHVPPCHRCAYDDSLLNTMPKDPEDILFNSDLTDLSGKCATRTLTCGPGKRSTIEINDGKNGVTRSAPEVSVTLHCSEEGKAWLLPDMLPGVPITSLSCISIPFHT